MDWLKLNMLDADDHIAQIYLPLRKKIPIMLGTGRNSVVFLARTAPSHDSFANEYRAVKFLRSDPDYQFRKSLVNRFFDEAYKTKTFGRLQESFLKYYGI